MKRERICLIIACLLSFALTTGIMERRMEVVHAEIAQTQKTLAEEVFRFHVIAESNSVKDQRIKLHVRDTVLSYMKSQMPETERKILSLVANRLLCATGEKHLYETVKADFSCNGHTFTVSGKSVTHNGWKSFVCFR